MAQALLDKDALSVAKYLERYNYYTDMEQSDSDSEIFIEEDIEDLLEAVKPENLIKVYPEALNARLGGGVVPGTQLAIYAPTEVGKTLFSINMACGFIKEGRKVLYCGNEDPARMMLLRFYARLSNMDRQAMLANPATARQRAHDRGYNKLVFYEMSPGSIFEMRKAVERFEPEVLFVDQMANMETSAMFSKTEKNEYLAVKIRELAKKFQLVSVIIHQASDSAYGQLAIQKNDMYYSNVGVQGQMDVMIGLGMDAAYEQQDKRMVCLTKNKVNSNHDHFPVFIEPQLTKVTSI